MAGGSAKRIQNELAEIVGRAPQEFSACPKGDNVYEWSSTIHGPQGAPHRPKCTSVHLQYIHRYVSGMGHVCMSLGSIRVKSSAAYTNRISIVRKRALVHRKNRQMLTKSILDFARIRKLLWVVVNYGLL